MAKKGLKRGLEHLFEDNDNLINDSHDGQVEILLIDDISPNPYQPRVNFDNSKIEELANSIKENGVFQPILVRKNIIGYEIIAGERRLRASKKVGLKEIPAIVYEYNDKQMMEISIIENIQREDLSVVEEALSYKKLIAELDYTQNELAQRLGISRSHVANLLRVTNLEENILKSLDQKEITLGHAKILIGIEDTTIREEIFNIILKEKINVRQTEKLSKDIVLNNKNKQKNTKVKKKAKSNFYKIEELMIEKLATKVEITGENKGQIKIGYESEDDLERLLELLKIIEE